MLMNEQQVQTLMEALPYLSNFKDKTIVVKYGGNAMLNDELKNKVLQDILFLQYAGMRPVVVHGGGPEISRQLEQAGKKSEFVGGLRVTDAESAAIAEMALVGKINTDLVGRLNALGGKAVGLNGKDANLLKAKKYLADVYENGEVNLVDIGFVGSVKEVNTDLINCLLDGGYIPVIAPTGVGDEGETYNINADVAAGEIAGALKAEKLLVLTDVRGIYSAYPDESSFISTLTFEKAHELILKGSIDGGMIPKVRSCIKALSGGAKKTHIIDGRAGHSILMELFSDKGVGTEVVKEI
ncbi:acetylglutamate kinase [Phascolarctobacterium succinatutens]|uniref:acetylglutamate kinase n=1 Tax=Phascolarctobacterium succinatutens TaxID=626940 RepID=UPI0023F1BA74|nr:acetylglutamate kinase [Phascolarctobacterium succinatutens]